MIPSGMPIAAEKKRGDHHERQGFERGLPVALVDDEDERCHDEGRQEH